MSTGLGVAKADEFAAGGRRPRAPGFPDAGVARQRQRALVQRASRPCTPWGCAERRAHQPAVECLRADEEVQHLATDDSGVEHVRALRDDAVAIAAGELWRAEAHVVPEPDPQRALFLPV